VLFQLVARQMVPAVAVAVIIGIGTCEFRELTVRIVLFRACLFSSPPSKISVTLNIWTHALSIKYRLITKLIA